MDKDTPTINDNALIHQLDNIRKQLSKHHTWRSDHAQEDAVDDLLFKLLESKHII